MRSANLAGNVWGSKLNRALEEFAREHGVELHLRESRPITLSAIF